MSFTAAKTVVLHVDGFGFAMDDGVIRNPKCGGVFTLDDRFGVSPTYLDKGQTKLDHGFGADEEARNFGFGRRGHNKLDYLGDSENMVIYGRDRDVFYELYVGTSGAAGFSDIEVGSI